MYSVGQFVFIYCIRPALKTAFNPYEFIKNLNTSSYGRLIIMTIIYSLKPNVKILPSVTFLIRKQVSCSFYTVEPPLTL